jgi:hypothetical protein
MTRIQNIFRSLAICCAVGAASSTSASTLRDLSFYGGVSISVDDGNGGLTGPSQSVLTGSATVAVPGSGGAETRAQIQGVTSPLPSVTASASNSVAGRTAYVSAVNNLDYWIRIVGPDALAVPLVISGNGSLFSTPTSVAYSQLILAVNYATIGYVNTTSGVATNLGGSGILTGFNPGSGDFAITKTLPVAANFDIFVHMYVVASVQGNAIQSSSAFLDPMFFIDPNFAGAGNYSIETSFGIGNGPVVTPLPAALPLFATGLGALGLLGWRRKRKNAAAIAA